MSTVNSGSRAQVIRRPTEPVTSNSSGTTGSTTSTSSTGTASGARTSTARPPVSADRVEAGTTREAEKRILRDTARASTTTPSTPSNIPAHATPAERTAHAANDRVARAESRLDDLAAQRFRTILPPMLGGTSSTPATRDRMDARITDARAELDRARTAAQAAGAAAVAEAATPAREAITESGQAQRTATASRNSPGAESTARTAVHKADAALAAQHRANAVAERVGQPVPFPAAQGVANATAAATLSPTAQATVLGAQSGTSPAQAAGIRADDKAAAARTAVEESGRAQQAARDAGTALQSAETVLAHATQHRDQLARDGAPRDQQLAAQRSVENAQADVASARSRHNRAETEARSAGDTAIRAQQEANSAAQQAGRARPFPAAEGLLGTADAASLTPSQQAQVLGNRSVIGPAEAARVDAEKLAHGSVEDRAHALNQAMQNPSAEYRDAFIAAAGPQVEELGRDAMAIPPTDEAKVHDVMNTVSEAMNAAGTPGGDRLQENWARGVQDVLLSQQQIQATVDMNDPAARNTSITEGYHQMAEQTSILLGRDNANWPAFGQHASAGAGEIIRGNMPEVWGQSLGGVDKNKIMDAVGDGNRTIYADIAPSFQNFNSQLLSDPRWRTDPARAEQMREDVVKNTQPPELGDTFGRYFDAAAIQAGPQPLSATRREELAQTIFRANTEVAAHEQRIAHGAVNDAIPDGNALGDAVSWLDPRGGGNVEEEATRNIIIQMGTTQLRVSEDVQGTIPPDLQNLQDPDGYWADKAREWGGRDSINDRGGSNVVDWGNYEDRMGYIMHMFRANQQNPDVWSNPLMCAVPSS